MLPATPEPHPGPPSARHKALQDKAQKPVAGTTPSPGTSPGDPIAQHLRWAGYSPEPQHTCPSEEKQRLKAPELKYTQG